MSFYPTQRQYTEFWTNEVFTMFRDGCTHKLKLVSNKTGEEINAFYNSGFTPVDLRFWDKSQITLHPGQFIEKNSLNPITHTKLFLQKKFTPIK